MQSRQRKLNKHLRKHLSRHDACVVECYIAIFLWREFKVSVYIIRTDINHRRNNTASQLMDKCMNINLVLNKTFVILMTK